MPGGKSAQIVIIIILIIALGFTSTAAYAYWTDVKTYSNVVLEFEGEDANLVIEQQSEAFTGMLVPEGHANFTNEVEEVMFVYEVSVDKELAKTMNLIVEAIDVTIDGVVDYEHLVEITIGNGDRYFVNELFNSVVTITITVRLLEPIDAAEAVERGLSEELVNVEDSEAAFNAIKGKTINFTISFRVETRV
ncbi:MAG: hypothetical protein A2013_05930 [Tenericutes bacterium GWE2_38_8]|nr:MAG: hypothetical protein A2013_05930 [Tenericutes bacterium GWE2_38_8]